jgi:hypothetical protein
LQARPTDEGPADFADVHRTPTDLRNLPQPLVLA